MRQPLPPVAAVLSFLDCINRGDVDGLGRLMTDDHRLLIFDEEPLIGRSANVSAWRGYADGFPSYVIYPHQIAEHDGHVAVLGHTTGSHLDLPDEEESKETLIWLAEVTDGKLSTWQLLPDTPSNRQTFGLA